MWPASPASSLGGRFCAGRLKQARLSKTAELHDTGGLIASVYAAGKAAALEQAGLALLFLSFSPCRNSRLNSCVAYL